MHTCRQYGVDIAMCFSLTVAVVVLCAVGYFRPVFCQAERGPLIPGPSITSNILKKYKMELRLEPEPKEQIVSLRREAMDSYSDCDENATEFNVGDILNENVVDEQAKRGLSIPGPPITSTILQKHNVKPQPVPESMKQTASTHPQSTGYKGSNAGAPGSDVDGTNDKDERKKKVEHRPAIPGPQITSTILKKHKLDGGTVPGANKNDIQNDKFQKEKDQKHNDSDNAEHNNNKEKGDNLDDEDLLKDMHRNVVLLEITFANNEIKHRTGTVIHDHVVITAAHCFEDYSSTRNNNVELSLSFVVIGTKKAFDRGTQHYLPIEKLVIHPEYKGWNADLALVFTYARIVTDNYGFPIPIEGYEPIIPDTSDLLVASWGKCNTPSYIPGEKYLYRSNQKGTSQKQSRADLKSSEATRNFRVMFYEASLENNSKISRDSILQMESDNNDGEILDNNANMELNRRKANILERGIEKKYIPDITDKTNRYLNHKQNKADFNDFITKLSKTEVELIKTDDSFLNGTEIFELYKNKLLSKTNTRRKMTQLKNRLVVGEFHLVNEKSCKDLVALIMPLKHKILNLNHYLCYSSLDKYLTRSDAGAAVIQDGKLLAVTAGGVESDGKHFGVGLKISCFCTWIAQNLPNGGDKFNCRKDCCGNRSGKGKNLRRGMQKNIIRSRKRGSRMQFNIRFLRYGDSSTEV